MLSFSLTSASQVNGSPPASTWHPLLLSARGFSQLPESENCGHQL
jgi:hypothetical protein